MDDRRHRAGPKLFIHAPPFKGVRSRETGEYISKRLARIQPPFHDAEPWQCSVFYFWWEFLRRHEGYKDCCDRGGLGRYKKLYSDFGDVHAYDTKDFWKWWSAKVEDDLTRGQLLFAEPAARRIELGDRSLNDQTDGTITLTIPLEVRTKQLVRNFRDLLNEHKKDVAAARKVSRALYPVAAKVRLVSLHQTLCVWDVWQEHKKRKKKYELAELAGLHVNKVVDGWTVEMLKRDGLDHNKEEREVRRRQTASFNRHLAAAKDYIENVGRGQFPKRN
ncbi:MULTISPECIES: hypothetical protein [unclassified Ruegeria]|uniref:hypothetical protein n=1 Tax=unclassified Ruegeria TaxID=2625375 RepID=UPI001487A318|nr:MULTISPECIES: hypothetical protein [unclassified Ruegeria]